MPGRPDRWTATDGIDARLRRLTVVVGVAVGLLLCLTTVVLTIQLALLGPRADRANAGALSLSASYVAMADQETGLRGYLLTDRPVFLQPYRSGSAALPRLNAQTLDALGGDPTERRLLRDLEARQQRSLDYVT